MITIYNAKGEKSEEIALPEKACKKGGFNHE